MLALLLSRAGVDVVLVEKHSDFLRDFRGDTVHPSTLEVMHELGLLQDLLQIPHTRAEQLHAEIGGKSVTIADFSRLRTQCRFIAFMPQWDFLTFLRDAAARSPQFRLVMNAEVTELTVAGERVSGLTVRTPDGDLAIDASLVVGADGRNSVVRDKAGLEIETFGAPTDVLWMKLTHRPDDPPYTMGHGGPKQGFVMIDRGDYWQCGLVLPKGGYAQARAAGLDVLRAAIAAVSPLPRERMDEIRSWDDVSLLSVRIDRLTQWWRPGLLCIGDAAHAMSPIGGVGVNLAIQDAVAAANILAEPLKAHRLTDRDLAAVQARRSFPTKATQKLQTMMRRERRKPGGSDPAQSRGRKIMGALARSPILARLAGRLIGLGFRPEHVRKSLR